MIGDSFGRHKRLFKLRLSGKSTRIRGRARARGAPSRGLLEIARLGQIGPKPLKNPNALSRSVTIVEETLFGEMDLKPAKTTSGSVPR